MLFGILRKELLLTFRDVHAVGVLFVLPMAFILIMSLALQDVDNSEVSQFDVALIIESSTNDKVEQAEIKRLLKNVDFTFKSYSSLSDFRQNVQSDDLIAGVYLRDDFFNQLIDEDKSTADHKPMQVYFAPTTPTPLRKLLLASLSKSIGAYQVEQQLSQDIKNPLLRQGMKDKYLGTHLVKQQTLKGENEQKTTPSSVQQSVPAWLIFSMFFVVIPISTTFIIEKQNGTLQRLMTLPVSNTLLLLGKLIPYLAINAVQTVLMFLVGIYLVPVAGGQGLVLSDNSWLLIPMALSVGVLAICLALFIATFVRSTEQATTVGGIFNLLLAAVGGIMVPTYVMPEFMRQIASYSPMNWGLEGFLTILLRYGQFSDIIAPMLSLWGLALLFFFMAVLKYRRAIA